MQMQGSPSPTAGVVAVATGTRRMSAHERGSIEALSRRLAALLDRPYDGLHALEALRGRARDVACFVPDDTLDAAQADALGIRSPSQLFGGVVPHRFAATKLVSHPAVDADARVPDGWPRGLGAALADAVLPGFSVFSAGDARRACRSLLGGGRVRVKLARGVGGKGQAVVASLDELEAFLGALAGDELERHGATLERHLDDAATWSVGTAQCGELRIAYVGTQRSTRDRAGDTAYGGSDLQVARGGFDDLLALPLADGARDAAMRASRYHEAMLASFPGFFASRCNYDVVAGTDATGRHASGVLEQSWRIGGASPAELAAMEAFAADPSLQWVRARCHEVHGECTPPQGATTCYRGDDPGTGPICKYAIVEAFDGRPA